MIKHVVTFTVTFILGALIALAARTATHSPHESAAAPASEPAAPAHDHAAAGHAPAMAAPATAAASTPAPAADASNAPVNTICAICGMKVDPSLPTLEYKGKRIGFGCRMCPPKFKANPDKYGPYYLRNELMPK